MAMHTWFECKIRYEKTMENGMQKNRSNFCSIYPVLEIHTTYLYTFISNTSKLRYFGYTLRFLI